MALHKYFQFASDKIERQLLDHRHNVHTLDPSLPHYAGRAYAKSCAARAPAQYAELPNGPGFSPGVVRPEPDVQMLAKLFLTMALDQLKGQG